MAIIIYAWIVWKAVFCFTMNKTTVLVWPVWR